MIILKINLQGMQLDGYLLSRVSMSFNNIIVYFFFFLIIFFLNWEKSNDTPGSNFGAKNDFESDEKQSALDSRFIYNT